MSLAASLTFLAPRGALVCLAALVPIAAAVLAERRVRGIAGRLGLTPASRRRALLRTAALAAACILLGLAAARPAFRSTEPRDVRTDAQAFFVFDISRSMLASPSSQTPTRLERAKAIALRLHAELGAVPAGLAGFSDRLLPFSFPSSDERVFRSVVARSVAVDAPPPHDVLPVASTFEALGNLQRRSFFGRSAQVRLCVVLTDGESRPFGIADVGAALLASPPCRLVVVRIGNERERIYDAAGRVEAQYRPRADSDAAVDALAAAAGGRAFDEGDADAAARVLRSLAGSGPVTKAGAGRRTTELAGYLALVAGLMLVGVVLGSLVLDFFVAFMQRSDYDRAQRA